MRKLVYGLTGLLLVLVGCAEHQMNPAGTPNPSLPNQEPSQPNQEPSQFEEVIVTASKSSGSGRYRAQKVHSIRQSRGAPEVEDRSSYPEFKENRIKVAAEDPVSTFSVDVDTASYGVMRSYLNRGVLPPASSIRTEEILNYFSYSYPLPKTKNEPFQSTVSMLDAPWSNSKKLLHIGIQGFDIEPEETPDSNLVFLLDVSGSMSADNKLPLLKKSIKLLLKSLKPTDHVSMVVYAGAAGVVLEPTKVKEKRKILSALDSLSAGGSTAGGAGLKLAYELAKENFDENAINRIFLATDGDFNVGASGPDDMKAMVEKNRDSGVYLSVLGFGGHNYQDTIMQAIAQYGNGTAAYIDTLQEAKKVLVDEATSALFPIANDVKIQIEFNPKKVAEYRLLGYETRQLAREDFNNDKVDAGEIGAGHSVTAIYEITPADSEERSVDSLRYGQDENNNASPNNNEWAFLKIRYKLPGEKISKKTELAITGDEAGSKEAKFAAAAAGFAELLRNSKNGEKFKIKDAIELAKANKGDDEFGYRAEFIRLMEMAKLL